jgi:predicted ArsR family transcriptional regulator
MRSREAQISAIAALDEPTRRRVYDYVVRQPEPVSRDEAAEALGVPRSTAAFHLDRLVEHDLLDVEYQRRSGRAGPGAGRPAKLYRRAPHQVGVLLPERRYELAGRLLSGALEQAERSGGTPRDVLAQRAYQVGKQIGEHARGTAVQVLEEYGFEPRADGDEIVLGNCPFHALAQEYTTLVCGMNLSLIDGVLDGLGATGLTARLNPAPPSCCVRLSSGKRVS